MYCVFMQPCVQFLPQSSRTKVEEELLAKSLYTCVLTTSKTVQNMVCPGTGFLFKNNIERNTNI